MKWSDAFYYSVTTLASFALLGWIVFQIRGCEETKFTEREKTRQEIIKRTDVGSNLILLPEGRP